MHNRQYVFAAVIFFLCTAAVSNVRAQGYGGPSLLSRGGNQPGVRGRAPIDFNIYASVRGIYETGLLAPTLDETGQLRSDAVYGGLVEAGVYGGRDWRRHSLGVDYRGDYRYQPAVPGVSGSNQALSLVTQHRLSRRLLLVLQEMGGTTNRAFGGFAGPTFGGIDRIGVPLNELFDVRMYYAQTAAGLSYQKSARTTFTIGGDAFFVKRSSFSLVNSQGYRAQGTVIHRINRRTSIVGNFQFMRFEFPRVYASSDIYGLAVGVQRTLTRNLLLDVLGGWYTVTSNAIAQVRLSPEVAAILGRPTGLVAFVRTERPPMVQATLTYLQERGRAYVTAVNGITPGNGVYLTTTRSTVNGGYSYSGTRKLSLGVSGGWSRQGSVTLNLQATDMWQGGGGFSYRLAEHLSLMGQADRRYFGVTAVRGRSGSSVSIGLAYTPSRFPISIW